MGMAAKMKLRVEDGEDEDEAAVRAMCADDHERSWTTSECVYRELFLSSSMAIPSTMLPGCWQRALGHSVAP